MENGSKWVSVQFDNDGTTSYVPIAWVDDVKDQV